MLLAQGHDISFNYENIDLTIFDNTNFSVRSGSRIGIIGKNGAGKSTLFKILLGKLEPHKGQLWLREDLVIGYLPQEICWTKEQSAEQFLWGDLWDLKNKVDQFDDGDATIFTTFLNRGGYQREIEIEKNKDDFNFSDLLLSRSIDTLSGGEKTKLALLKIVLEKPSFILLDEPTNHLDLSTIEWIERYLSSIDVPFLVISHDRRFLNRCVNEIWEIGGGGLRTFSGNYSFYRKQIDEENRKMLCDYENQQKKLKQLSKALNERKSWAFSHQGETGKNGYAPVYESVTNYSKSAMKRAKNVEKRIEMMIEREEKVKPRLDKKRKLSFEENVKMRSQVVISFQSVSKSFLSDSFDFEIERGERVALIGSNGVGKSTILKIAVGAMEADFGVTWIAPSAAISYFAQEYENLDQSNTIINEVAPQGDQTKARTFLGCLGIEKDKVYQRIETLSLGERSKVALAKVLLSGANLMILDEPTNHLEIEAKEAVERALQQYEGTLFIVSHDREFIDRVTNRKIYL